MKDLTGEDQIVKLVEGRVGEYACYLGAKDYFNKTLKVQTIQFKSQWLWIHILRVSVQWRMKVTDDWL